MDQSKAGKRLNSGVMCVILNSVFREDHTDKVTSEQRPEGGEGESSREEHSRLRVADANALRWGILACSRTGRGPVWLQRSE